MSVGAVRPAFLNAGKPRLDHLETLDGSGQAKRQISLAEAIPTDFRKFYELHVFADPTMINKFGRPRFTERDLEGWVVNDIRSVLFVHALRPEWQGTLPTIEEDGWNLTFMPQNASVEDLVRTLTTSCLYADYDIGMDVREALASWSVSTVRAANSDPEWLSLPKWRSLIETFMLCLACEVETAIEFEKLLHIRKREILAQTPSTTIASTRRRLEMAHLRGSPPPDILRTVNVPENERRQLWLNARGLIYKQQGLRREVTSD